MNRWTLIGALALLCLAASAPTKAQGPGPDYGEGNFLVRCEAQWQQNMPWVGPGIAEVECEAEWYFIYSDPDCDIECKYETYFGTQVQDEDTYEGNEGGVCITCDPMKPD